jgi:hypothetical protein
MRFKLKIVLFANRSELQKRTCFLLIKTTILNEGAKSSISNGK